MRSPNRDQDIFKLRVRVCVCVRVRACPRTLPKTCNLSLGGKKQGPPQAAHVHTAQAAPSRTHKTAQAAPSQTNRPPQATTQDRVGRPKPPHKTAQAGRGPQGVRDHIARTARGTPTGCGARP